LFQKIRDFYQFKNLLLHFVFTAFMVVVIIFNEAPAGEKLFDLIKVFIAFGASLTCWWYISQIRLKYLSSTLIIPLMVATFVSVLEVCLRLQNFKIERLLENFYNYKIDSPFFYDSNAAGIYSLLTLILLIKVISLKLNHNKVILNCLLISLVITIFLSFSRAAIIAMFTLFVFKFYQKSNLSKIVCAICLIILLTLNIENGIEILQADGSGNSKLLIYSATIQLMGEVSLSTLMFGQGMNYGAYVYSYEAGSYAHALLPMLLGQVGVVGTFVYVCFFYLFARLNTKRYMEVLFPIMVVGLSYLHPFLEMIFAITAICFAVDNKLKRRHHEI
jgi:hypothetical protein